MDVVLLPDGVYLVFKSFGDGGKYPRYTRKRVCRQFSALFTREKAVKLAGGNRACPQLFLSE